MPGNVKSRAEMHSAARYAPALSHPILDAIAEAAENDRPNGAMVELTKSVVQSIESKAELSMLFADLICALNGTDWLPFVAGVIGSQFDAPRTSHEAE